MKYRIEAEEKFIATQYLIFEIEADSAEEAARKVEDYEAYPEIFGDIIPAMEGETERTIIEIKPC
jgi:hypothetical protein